MRTARRRCSTPPRRAAASPPARCGPDDAGVPRGCDALAKAITVPGSCRRAWDERRLLRRLPAAAKELEAARSAGMHELAAARSATAQAAAADGLVWAHERAVAALAPLTGTRADLAGETVCALTAMAVAYATLAPAARALLPAALQRRSPRRRRRRRRPAPDAGERRHRGQRREPRVHRRGEPHAVPVPSRTVARDAALHCTSRR